MSKRTDNLVIKHGENPIIIKNTGTHGTQKHEAKDGKACKNAPEHADGPVGKQADKGNYWLYLEPYVHVSLKKNKALLYNSLKGDILEYDERKPEVLQIIKRLMEAEDPFVIGVDDLLLAEFPAICGFIELLRRRFMGDLLKREWSKSKPVQLAPILKINKDPERLQNAELRSVGEGMMLNLQEISIYLDNSCRHNCSMCGDAFRQFPYCRANSGTNGEKRTPLDKELIHRLIRETEGSTLSYINILGGDIFLYPDFYEIVGLLNSLPQSKCYYSHYRNLENRKIDMQRLRGENNTLQCLVDLPVDASRLESAMRALKGGGIHYEVIFIVRNEDNIEAAEDLVDWYGLNHVSIRPYYDGNNLSLFEKFVYVNKEMVRRMRPGLREILANSAVNTSRFGKLTILNDGAVHAGMNEPALGRFGEISLYDAVYKEMLEGNSWRRVRKKVAPCSDCTYDSLCPSLTEYEYAIGQNNLCHMPEV
ncbi:MAG: TIGR04150 pseudo-rSAM protein [bacterium]|nr:TIGR04150 pseudo-rSAM protein [bacterium]